MSDPKELRTEKQDEEETSLKPISGSPEDTGDILDTEEIARTAALVCVPSDELSFPVQESTHDSDGLEALGAVGETADEAYERKVRVAIMASVAKSLFTGLAHHLSDPAGPGPDWVPLARAAGITGPEIEHIIDEAAKDMDKGTQKMLKRSEEGKTGDRPIKALSAQSSSACSGTAGDLRAKSLKANKSISLYEPVERGRRYKLLLINSFMAHGGDGYSMLADNVPESDREEIS
ncbi:5'-nucleotidase [Branchiostoma belcheri]|nr:5'-nucleotidase [Branchiostoma belcheri]